MENEFKKIKNLLDNNKIIYEIKEHEPVFTSEQAAKVRGIELKSGAKSMIVKSEGKFYNLIISAAKKIDFNKIKKILNKKSVSLATPEEVLKNTGCEIGSVPPFGNLFNLTIYCDPSLLENEYIDFNAGLHNLSIRMKSKDWVVIVNPIIIDFSK